MLIKFWKSEDDSFPMLFAANHIATIEVVTFRNGANELQWDVLVYTAGGQKFRFPFITSNIASRVKWEHWIEGQQ